MNTYYLHPVRKELKKTHKAQRAYIAWLGENRAEDPIEDERYNSGIDWLGGRRLYLGYLHKTLLSL